MVNDMIPTPFTPSSWRALAGAAALCCSALLPPTAAHAQSIQPPAAKATSTAAAAPTSTAKPRQRATPKAQPSADVLAMHRWVQQTGDNRGGPFMVLDKRQARLWVFDRLGRTLAQSPVLLGVAIGDDSVPGIGERPMSQILPHERTTPAGRYWAEPGVNAHGEDIFWVDYDVAVSLHRVRANNPAEQRLQRLATPSEKDNRISYGCINVPAAFYDGTVKPLFTAAKGWIYVLPETRPVQTMFKPADASAPAG
jgi:hypothetical protein